VRQIFQCLMVLGLCLTTGSALANPAGAVALGHHHRIHHPLTPHERGCRRHKDSCPNNQVICPPGTVLVSKTCQPVVTMARPS